ncbi:hypothetical protein OL239_05095 [Arthrobacter sp. ATA002]|uniref:hypothetical protein n=1 Tax=Arthrobacter sp. ATA002 TaxID=2991715 RepID=UPI0022A7B1E6|nr:hypothetical protein [Arthrobacter sp. ATA002]WAP52605.1 hypothetical protein OL239_05095 [Arthrobacter sp. ATA002]
MSGIVFAPGETGVSSSKFSPSVILFWLKTEIAVTNMRVVAKSPNTLFGVIPLGYKDEAYPLSGTASVGVEVKFSFARALFGLIFLIIGLNLLDNFFGYILLLLAISMILNAMSAALQIKNHGGGSSTIRVSILEKSKLESMRDEINARLFADHARVRHEESMGMQTQSLLNQQAQINLQQQMHQQTPQGTGYGMPPAP